MLPASREQALIASATADPQAFHQLYGHYFPRVYAYVAYRVGREQDAEDLVAEIFLSVVAALADFEYRGEGSFAAWLFRIAANRVNRFYRESRRTAGEVSLDQLPEIVDNARMPDASVLRDETISQLRLLVANLAPRRREIVQLKFFGRLRNKEIAAVLELDERTVASHLSRALKDLQRSYRQTLEEEARLD